MQRLIGDDPLQPAVFILERTHLHDVDDLHAAEFGLPLVKGLRTHAVLPAQLFGRCLCLRMPTIRASVNRDLRIWWSPRGRASGFSTYRWTTLRATRQPLYKRCVQTSSTPLPFGRVGTRPGAHSLVLSDVGSIIGVTHTQARRISRTEQSPRGEVARRITADSAAPTVSSSKADAYRRDRLASMQSITPRRRRPVLAKR